MKKFIPIIFTLIISVIFTALFLINKELNAHNLSNAFFFTSIIYLSISGYSFVMKMGLFSGFSYSIKRLKHIIFRPTHEYEGTSSIYDQYRHDIEKRKEYKLYITIFFVGLINLIIAIYFTYYV